MVAESVETGAHEDARSRSSGDVVLGRSGPSLLTAAPGGALRRPGLNPPEATGVAGRLSHRPAHACCCREHEPRVRGGLSRRSVDIRDRRVNTPLVRATLGEVSMRRDEEWWHVDVSPGHAGRVVTPLIREGR